MKIHEIGQFYGERFGWRMFDARFLTNDVQIYLNEEEEFLQHVMSGGYDYLVEVGCGYGRYLDWAMSRGYSYTGVDIVPWMVDIGKLRAERARKSYESLNCSVLISPAELVEKVINNLDKEFPESRFLVFFPFNSLGNISSLNQALESLENAGVDVVVSTFKTDASPTNSRLDYYKKCGYENLNSRLMRQGLLIVSDEGFHAIAYNKDWLCNRFEAHGFDLNSEHEKGHIGRILYFNHKRRKRRRVLSQSGEQSFDAIVHVVDPLSEESGQSASLNQMDEFRANLTVISSSMLSCRLPKLLKSGSFLHLNVSLTMSNNQIQYYDLSAVVESANKSGDAFETVIRLPKVGWIEKVGLRKASR